MKLPNLLETNRTGFERSWRPREIRADKTIWTPTKMRALRYTPDDGDYWQLPHETAQRGRGDCEDLSIVRLHYWYTGRGFPASTLYLIVGYIRSGWHAVAYNHELELFYNSKPRSKFTRVWWLRLDGKNFIEMQKRKGAKK